MYFIIIRPCTIDRSACMRALVLRISVFTPVRSQKLGTAFRSPVTTLAHHYEVVAPDLRLRFHTEFEYMPVDSELPRSIRFRSRDRGDIFAPNLLPAPSFGALVVPPGLHSLSGRWNLFR
jgi:hypothetical protein